MKIIYAKQEIKFVHILTGLPFGGNESLCLQILKHAPENIENILLNVDPSRQEMLNLFQQIKGVKIIELTYRKEQLIRSIYELFLLFRATKAEGVLCYAFSLVSVWVGLAARLAGIQTIAVHAGNMPPQEPSQRFKWKLLIWLFYLLNIKIYPCSMAVQRSLEELSCLQRGSYAIPNGCDVENIANRAQKTRQQRLTSQLIIGMVARLNSIKDHETLIRAFAQLIQKFPQGQLWLVGDGEERSRLEHLSQILNIQDAVVFFGNRVDIPELMGQMDIFVFSTTEAEGFGIAIIEAMAAGLPIVASEVSACREVLNGNEIAQFFPVGNIEILVKVLEKFSHSLEDRTYYAQRGSIHVLDKYNIQTCSKRWYHVLNGY